jgi:hypothetical protein
MPFSRENIKFTVLTIGFVLMVVTGVAGVVAIAYSKTTASTPLYTTLVGFVTIQAGQLLNLLRTEQAHAEIARTRHVLRGDVGTAIKLGEHVANQTQEVKQELDATAPFTPIQLRMIEEIVSRICDKRSLPPAPPGT